MQAALMVLAAALTCAVVVLAILSAKRRKLEREASRLRALAGRRPRWTYEPPEGQATTRWR